MRQRACKYGSIIDGSVRLGAYSNAPIPLICDNWRHEARDGLVAALFCCRVPSTRDLSAVTFEFGRRHFPGCGGLGEAFNFFNGFHILGRTSISPTFFVFSGFSPVPPSRTKPFLPSLNPQMEKQDGQRQQDLIRALFAKYRKWEIDSHSCGK